MMIVRYTERADIYAKCVRKSDPDCSWITHDLVVGKLYEVDDIQMGQIYTDIFLKGKDLSYNSIIFEFYENGEKIDIYRDKRFNPYIRHRKGE